MEVLPTANFQPDVVLLGLRIGEPMIALTSILVSFFCFYAWVRLGKMGLNEDSLRLSRRTFWNLLDDEHLPGNFEVRKPEGHKCLQVGLSGGRVFPQDDRGGDVLTEPRIGQGESHGLRYGGVHH